MSNVEEEFLQKYSKPEEKAETSEENSDQQETTKKEDSTQETSEQKEETTSENKNEKKEKPSNYMKFGPEYEEEEKEEDLKDESENDSDNSEDEESKAESNDEKDTDSESEKKSSSESDEEEGGGKDQEEIDLSSPEISSAIEQELGASVDDIREILEQNDELVDKLEEYENSDSDSEPEFANDFVKQMNDYVKNGGNPVEFARINGMDVDNMKPQDAIRENYKLKHGLSDDEANALINKNYGLGDDDDQEDPAVQAQLKVEGNQAKDELKKFQADNTIPEKPSEDPSTKAEDLLKEHSQQFIEKDKKRVEEWDEIKDEIAANNSKLSISLDNKGENSFEYELKGEDLDSVKQAFMTMVQEDPNVTLDEHGENADEMFRKIAFAQHGDSIVKSVAEKVRSQKDEEFYQKTHNPSTTKEQPKPEDTKKEKSGLDIVREAEGI